MPGEDFAITCKTKPKKSLLVNYYNTAMDLPSLQWPLQSVVGGKSQEPK